MPQVRLVDEEAQQVVRDAARSRVEGCLDRALACTKRRTKARDYSDAVSELRSAIDYNRALAALKGDTELPPGLGAASVAGSEWEAVDGRSRDVRELFRCTQPWGRPLEKTALGAFAALRGTALRPG
jgi:hypothetical protein